VRALGQYEPELPTIPPDAAGTAGYHTDQRGNSHDGDVFTAIQLGSASFEGSSEGGWVVNEVCARKGSVFMRHIPYL
jgi:hypothetical protein